jgi:hypothetical protein
LNLGDYIFTYNLKRKTTRLLSQISRLLAQLSTKIALKLVLSYVRSLLDRARSQENLQITAGSLAVGPTRHPRPFAASDARTAVSHGKQVVVIVGEGCESDLDHCVLDLWAQPVGE